MKKILMIVSFLFLLNHTSTEPARTYANSKDDNRDFSTIIVEVIINNIDKLPNKRVAVMNFSDINGQDTEEGKLLAEQITTKLTTDGNIKVIERQQLNKILEEQQLKLSGLTETSDQEIGKILNIDAIISGTIAHIDDYEEVNGRMIDVKTGEIYCAANAKKQLRLRQQEFQNLSSEERDKINKEFQERENLRKKNPELFKISEEQKAQLWQLRETQPKVFQRMMKTIRVVEKLKTNRPKIFLLVTGPRDAPPLQKIKQNKPELFDRILKLRDEVAFVIKNVPAYKKKILFDREKVIRMIKEE